MPTIKLKNNTTSSATPSSLANGELAVNPTDNKMYVGNSGVVKIVGSLGNQNSNSVSITGGAVSGTTIASGTLATSNLQLNSGNTVSAVDSSATAVNSTVPTQNAVSAYATSLKGGLKQIISFTSSGTYTKSGPDVTRIKVICVGAGGGGRGYGEGGGAGGMSELVIDATGITSVSVTVGSGGAGGQYFGFSGGGNTTSFGGYCSASGGSGANANYQHCGGHGGMGYGGNVNTHGGGGSGHKNAHSSSHHNPGHGGQSFFGGSNAGSHYTERYAENIGAPGSGGGGHNFYGNGAFSAGYNGLYGICVIYEYR